MSKGKAKRKGAQQTTRQASPPQGNAPHALPPKENSPQAKTEWLKTFPWWNAANTILGVFALLMGGLSVYYYRQQAVAAKEANDRVSGRIGAKLQLVDSIPNTETLPLEKRKPIFGTQYTTAYVDNSDTLRDLRMRVVLKNIGEEAIDTIRLSVKCERGFGVKDQFKLIGNQVSKGPFSTDSYSKEDFVLDQKLNPTEVILVPLSKGMLTQMLEVQWGADVDDERYGEFVIKPSAKIVGGTSFDGIYDDTELTVRLLWSPKGFEEEKCRKLIDRMQLKAEIKKTSD